MAWHEVFIVTGRKDKTWFKAQIILIKKWSTIKVCITFDRQFNNYYDITCQSIWITLNRDIKRTVIFSLSNVCRIQSHKMSFSYQRNSIQYDTTDMKFFKISNSLTVIILIFHWYYSQITKIEFNQTNYQIKSSKHSTERNLSLHNSRNDKCRDKMWDFLMPRKRAKSFRWALGMNYCIKIIDYLHILKHCKYMCIVEAPNMP